MYGTRFSDRGIDQLCMKRVFRDRGIVRLCVKHVLEIGVLIRVLSSCILIFPPFVCLYLIDVVGLC